MQGVLIVDHSGCIIGVIPLAGGCYQVAVGPPSSLDWGGIALGLALEAKKRSAVWGFRWCNFIVGLVVRLTC